MKKHLRLLSLLLAGAMTLSLCACKPAESADPSGEPSADPSGDPSPSPSIAVDLAQDAVTFSAGMAPTDIVLTVNGVELPADLVLYWLSLSCSNFLSQYGQYTGLGPFSDTLRDDTVTVCAYHTLLRQKAAQLGCPPTDAQVQTARDAMFAQGEDYFNRFKSIFGLTDSSAEYFFLSDAYYDNVREALTHIPDEQELDEYLDANKVYRVKHILFKTVDDNRQPLSEDVTAGKKAQAEEILAQLQAVDADGLEEKFDELMMAHSEDNPQNNPDGYITNPFSDPPFTMVKEFEDASMALGYGELSGIVETAFGYHIILRLPLPEEKRVEYAEYFRDDALTDLLGQWLEESEVVRAPALDELDVPDWFDRLVAYQQAFIAEQGEG